MEARLSKKGDITMAEITPRITTIMAVYNMADTVQRSLNSAADQDYANKELIVIEGASSDHTVEILKKNEHCIDYWESVDAADRGLYKQWNRALPHVTGEWINFLGADDYFPVRDVLSRMQPHLINSDGVRLVYGQIALIRPDGSRIGVHGQPWEAVKEQMYRSLPIPHPATFHHRSLFDIHGKFDESFQIAGDYEFLLRELKNGKAKFIPDIIVRDMTFGGMSSSWKHDMTRLFENARARKLNSLPAYTWPWFRMFMRRFARYLLFRTFGEKNVRRIQSALKA